MRDILRGAALGTVGAMAMTGMRRITTGLGLVPAPPPQEIASEGLPRLLASVPAEHRGEVVELAHWAFGAAAGAFFAGLPPAFRERAWAGPAYGLAIQALFELSAAPLLGLRRPAERALSERLAVAGDHVLYGLILSEHARREGV